MKLTHQLSLKVIGTLIGIFAALVSLKIGLVLLLLFVALLTIDKWSDHAIYIPIGYIFVDYFIRKIAVFSGIASLWDELFLVGMIALLIYKRFKSEGTLRYRQSPMDLPVLMFITLGIAHVLMVSPEMDIAIEGFRAVFQQVFWYFIFTQFIITPDQSKKVMNIMVVMGLALGLHAIYQYVAGVQMPGNWVDSTEQVRTRAFSIIGSPNILGVLFVLFMPITMGLAASTKKWLPRLFYIGSLGVMTLGLFFTLSRGSWLAFGLSLAIFAFFINWKLIMHLGALGGVLLLSGGGFSQRIMFMFSPTYLIKSAAGGRIMRWTTGLEEWSQSPILGLGLGRYGGAVAMNHKLAPFYVDNYYLKTLIEMGVFGAATFVFMIGSMIHFSVKTIGRQLDPEHRWLTIGLFSAAVGVLAQNCVENIFEFPAMVFYFWLVVALINVYRPEETTNEKQSA